MKATPINPDRVLDPRLKWQRGFKQRVTKKEFAAYVEKYGTDITTYDKKPSLFNIFSLEKRKRPLQITPIRYTNLLEITVYWVGDRSMIEKERIRPLSEEDDRYEGI